MVDWMIQVFRVIDRSNEKTFFLAVNLLDRFFQAASAEGRVLLKSELHKYGLTCILIASKLEDVYTITMEEITVEAGHGRVKPHHIVEAENDLCKTLQFKLYSPTLYEEAVNDLL
jgi:cyclin B